MLKTPAKNGLKIQQGSVENIHTHAIACPAIVNPAACSVVTGTVSNNSLYTTHYYLNSVLLFKPGVPKLFWLGYPSPQKKAYL